MSRLRNSRASPSLHGLLLTVTLAAATFAGTSTTLAAGCLGKALVGERFDKLPGGVAKSNPYLKVNGGKLEMKLTAGRGHRVSWNIKESKDIDACVTVSLIAGQGKFASLQLTSGDVDLLFALFPSDGQAGIYRHDNARNVLSTPVARSSSPAIHSGRGAMNRLHVRFDGRRAIFYINDRKFGSVTGALPAGPLKLSLAGFSQPGASATWAFDELLVTPSKPAATAVAHKTPERPAAPPVAPRVRPPTPAATAPKPSLKAQPAAPSFANTATAKRTVPPPASPAKTATVQPRPSAPSAIKPAEPRPPDRSFDQPRPPARAAIQPPLQGTARPKHTGIFALIERGEGGFGPQKNEGPPKSVKEIWQRTVKRWPVPKDRATCFLMLKNLVAAEKRENAGDELSRSVPAAVEADCNAHRFAAALEKTKAETVRIFTLHGDGELVPVKR